MRRTLFPLLCSALLSGCPMPAKVCDVAGRTPGLRPLFFAMKVIDKGQPKGYRVIRKQGVVRSGERYYLNIDVPDRGYVYVVQDSADKRQQLWPELHTAPASWDPSRTLILPRPGEFQLDTTTGDEDIYVVASPAPLSPEQLAEAVKNAPAPRDSDESTKNTVQGTVPGPGELEECKKTTCRDDGPVRRDLPESTKNTPRGEAHAYTCPDSSGILSMRFRFRHE